jgi:hypothetical protein
MDFFIKNGLHRLKIGYLKLRNTPKVERMTQIS